MYELVWGSLFNSRHPDPRRVWKGVPICGWWHLIAGIRGLSGLSRLAGQRGWITKSSKLMVYAVLEHPWPSQKRPEASRGLKSLTHIERSEIPGYKLPAWDTTWGTCLEQSLFKIYPWRLKMKKSFLGNFRRWGPGWSSEIEKSLRKIRRYRFFGGTSDN